ncbi:MAG: endonuclease/exonuclease/phosphatase family protein [Chthoniobacteraceae bacterium]
MRIPLPSIRGILPLLLALAILPATARAEDKPLRVVSYNVRVPLDKTPYTWPERRDAVVGLLKDLKPDIFGTQEGIATQLADIDAALPDFARLGQGREGGEKGEYSAIYFRKDRVEPLKHGDFWLSDTPEQAGSMTWGNKLPRMVTWARCKDLATGREFVWFNTHFDHQSQPSREKSAALLAQRANELGKDLPVIITGDFNAGAGQNPAFDILTKEGNFTDSWTAAAKREGEGLSSFNSFRAEPDKRGVRIDWVLFRGPFKVSEAAVVAFQKDGRFPSDHCPVLAVLHYTDAK